MAPMNGDAPAEPLHDFGVLFVHGIGQTREAETLLNFGEPLRRCIEKIAEPYQGAQNQVRVTVSAARLDPETGKGPAYAQLRINGAAETEQSWLLAEGWWAKKFPTAPVSEIVRWGFRVFPWTLLAHFDRRFRRLGFRSVNAINGVHPLRLGLPYVGRCLLEGAMTVVALALLPLLLLILSALTLLGIFPYEPIRKLAQSVQRVLASTIGDSYVLKDQPMVAAAITESVRGNLEWLAQRCKKVAVVAHSQGGAIAHRVLRGPITSQCDLLVTFGSGLGKLSDIERVDEFQGRRLLNWAIAGTTIAAAPLLVSSFFAWWHHSLLLLVSSLAQAFGTVELGIAFVIFDLIRANPRDDSKTPADALPSWALAVIYLLTVGVIYTCLERSLRAWPIILGNVLIGSGLTLTYGSIRRWHALSGRSLNTRTQWLQDRKLFRDNFQLDNRHWMRWVDIYASADPVPNGPLLDDFEPRDVLTTEITNVGSALKDHTAYWKNTDEFLPRVAIELLQKAGLKKRFYNSLGVSSRRRWRVGWLLAALRVLGLIAIGLAYSWVANPPPVLARGLNAMHSGGAPMSLFHDHPKRLALVLVVSLWILARSAVLLAWRWWDNNEAKAGLAGREYSLLDKRFLCFVSLLALCVFSVAYAVFGWPGLVAGAFVSLCGSASLAWKGCRNWLTVRSESGPRRKLGELRLAELRGDAELAIATNNKRELTRMGNSLLYQDQALAIRALSKAAALGSANAAWQLGYYYSRAAERESNEEEKKKARRNAKDAFRMGAFRTRDEDADAYCAQYLAGMEKQDGQMDEAIAAYQQAIKLGDFMSATSLGLILEKRGEMAEAKFIFQKGADLGDGLSATFLGGRLECETRELDKTNPDEAGRLRARALDLYRRGFELGEVSGVSKAGNLLREMGKLALARREFTLGARLGDAGCAYQLGCLEQGLDDTSAARAAYELAVRRNENSTFPAQARYRLGKMFEAEGKLGAAADEFRTAMDGQQGSAEAAVALGLLLEKGRPPENRPDKDLARNAFRRALELNKSIGALPYVTFLERESDYKGLAIKLYKDGIDDLPGDALFRLGCLLRVKEYSNEATETLKCALEKRSVSAAVELYRIFRLEGNATEAASVIETAAGFAGWFGMQVLEAFEKKHEIEGARALKKRLEQSSERIVVVGEIT
jgi:tetratricopeptide (TPR) repeat protein